MRPILKSLLSCLSCLVSHSASAALSPHRLAIDQDSTLSRSEVSWRPARSPDPRGGSDYEALLQTADFDRSDVDFAGMMVRCRDKRLETIFVVLNPLPPRTPARVTIAAEGQSESYEATLIPTGAGLVVPIEIDRDLRGRWRRMPDLTVTIKALDKEVTGAVSLTGLAEPLSRLETSCLSSIDSRQGDANQ